MPLIPGDRVLSALFAREVVSLRFEEPEGVERLILASVPRPFLQLARWLIVTVMAGAVLALFFVGLPLTLGDWPRAGSAFTLLIPASISLLLAGIWSAVLNHRNIEDRSVVVECCATEFMVRGFIEQSGVVMRDARFFVRADLLGVDSLSNGVQLRIAGGDPILIGGWCANTDWVERFVKLVSAYQIAPAVQNAVVPNDPASALAYESAPTNHELIVRETADVLECRFGSPDTWFSSTRPLLRSRSPGLASFIDLMMGRHGKSARNGGYSPVIAISATASELWIVHSRLGELPERRIYSRHLLAEFRLNRFDGGLFIRIVGEEVGNLMLPGTASLARLAHRAMASRLGFPAGDP